MKLSAPKIPVFTLALLLILATVTAMRRPPVNDRAIADFSLRNVNGKQVSLQDYPDAKGFIIVFTCNHCPFAKLCPPRLNALNTRYKALGVPLIAISSTDTLMHEEDTYLKMVVKSQNERFNFPYLYDDKQAVAKNFAAQKTPHAFVVWRENGQWLTKYSGAIDDNGGESEKVVHAYVASAVDALLAGKKVAVKETGSIGCQIYFRK